MDGLFARLGLADTHADLVRNIISLRISEDLFDDLSDDPAERQVAVEVEIQTKPPTYRSTQPIIARPFEEADWASAIGFPFTHWSASRYSTGNYGVWYGTDDLETSVHETAHYWLKFLGDSEGAAREGVSVERRVHGVHCDAALLDFRPHVEQFPALIHPTDYSYCQQIGARVHREGHPGVVTRSARCGGTVYAVFRQTVLSNPRTLCYLTYRLHADKVNVERVPGTLLMTIPRP